MPSDNSFDVALQWGTAELSAAGIGNPGLDARLLLCHAADLSREALIAQGAGPVTEAVATHYGTLIARRRTSEPIARILGRKEFWSLDLKLGQNTLVPRPDSECIVAALLNTVSDRAAALKVLDLGTGSGCLLLALLSELPNANGVGIDVSPGAIDVARENAEQCDLGQRARFNAGHWAAEISDEFDLVISNPPYITASEMTVLPDDVRLYDPHLALDGGVDGLDAYRLILNDLAHILKPNAYAAFETSPQLIKDLWRLVGESGGFVDLVEIKDLSDQPRGLRFRKAH